MCVPLQLLNARCDVIKQNELELANIDLWIIADNSIKFPLYFIVLSSTKVVTISLITFDRDYIALNVRHTQLKLETRF